MGRPKLLLPWRGHTVIEQVVRSWSASRIDRVVVVVRPDDQALQAVCRRLPVDLVTPAVAPPDMKTSIQHALRHLHKRYAPAAEDAWLVAPADMPGLSGPLIDRLLQHYAQNPRQIVVPVRQGRRGHPVVFPWTLQSDVFRLAADEGINRLLKEHPVQTVVWDDDAILQDLDTPEDYRRWRPPDEPMRPNR